MRAQRALVAPLAALVFSLLGPAPASAQDDPKASPSTAALDDAATRFQRGLELYKEGDYKAAQVEFKRAYEIAPNYRVLYNLGQVSYQLRDYASALRSFQAYLEQGGREVSAARRNQVTAEINRLRSRVGNVVIEADAAGADVSIDDNWVGKTPLEGPQLVSAGQHKISVLKPGSSSPVVRTVEVGGGDKAELTFELGPVSPPAPEPSTQPAPEPARPPPIVQKPEPPNRVPLYVAWGATGALAVSTVVMALVANGQEGKLDDLRGEVPVSRDELKDAQSRVHTFGLVTDVLGVATLVAGGVATYITLRPNAFTSPSSRSGASPSPPAGLSSWRFGVGPGSVSLGATF
jgi:PEGA domain/Tetratricopeptide repeat